AGTYTVTLTVTDNGGATSSTSQSVTVSASSEQPTNEPPTASFTATCSDLTCSFTDASTDADGAIAEWSWDFGDGATSTAQHPSHSYAAAGTYTVTLTVTDNGGATSSTSQSVTANQPPSGITLSVTGTKVKGTKTADLSWSGAAGSQVDIYRDGAFLERTANDGAHTDSIGKGGGTHTYKVCEGGTLTCSPEVSVSY
ncbi:MAG TPA: PKD domain-containing protein, partial [Candidatus Limnocylindrales bacterium]|nr:PKD domain-containing protein [Candidatus Limnocylindrales bacterium]